MENQCLKEYYVIDLFQTRLQSLCVAGKHTCIHSSTQSFAPPFHLYSSFPPTVRKSFVSSVVVIISATDSQRAQRADDADERAALRALAPAHRWRATARE